jgi:hypothetical protein
VNRPAAAHPHPRETLDRCALRAQLRGDPMLGTAFPAAVLLLVEQPGPWGRNGLRDSRFGPLAAPLEQRAAAAGVRLQAIRRPGRTPAGATLRWAFVDTRDAAETLVWGTYREAADLLDLPIEQFAADPAAAARHAGPADTQPVYLVCAHSKHDTCCALRGRPVAAAIEAARPGRVWECSHLGGDRFAANVLVLPTGLSYGRVLPFAADEFVAAAEAGEVVGALLRGRIGLPPPAQAALAFAHEHLALRRRRDLVVESTGSATAGNTVVRLRGPHGSLDVTVAAEVVATEGLTCRTPGRGHFVQYRPIDIQVVPEPTAG